MKRNIFYKSFLDGVLRFLFLRGILVVYAFEFARDFPFDVFWYISALGATLSACAYMYFLINEMSNKKIVLFSLCSECCCVACWIITFVNLLTLHISVFPMRELNNGDGIAISVCICVYVFVSVVLRCGVFIALLIKNIYRTRKKK